MRPLVSREVGSVGSLVFCSRMIPGGTSYSMTNETFVVSNVFGALGGGEVDSVYVHCHGIFGGSFGSRVSGGVPLSAS